MVESYDGSNRDSVNAPVGEACIGVILYAWKHWAAMNKILFRQDMLLDTLRVSVLSYRKLEVMRSNFASSLLACFELDRVC